MLLWDLNNGPGSGWLWGEQHFVSVESASTALDHDGLKVERFYIGAYTPKHDSFSATYAAGAQN